MHRRGEPICTHVPRLSPTRPYLAETSCAPNATGVHGEDFGGLQSADKIVALAWRSPATVAASNALGGSNGDGGGSSDDGSWLAA